MTDRIIASIIPARRVWSAAAMLAFQGGTTLSSIMVLAETKAPALAAAIQEAEKHLPSGVGNNYSIIASHATEIHPDVLRAALDEISQEPEFGKIESG